MAIDLSSTNIGELNGIFFANSNLASQEAGKINSFLRLDGSGDTEQGYNTDGTLEFDTKKRRTRAISLSDLPEIEIGGVEYVEVRLDVNERSRRPLITLDELRLYASSSSDLTGYDEATKTLAGLSPVIDLDGNGDESVEIDASIDSGNGSGDALVYLPKEAFGEGNPYIYLFSKFDSADGKFEEWSFGEEAALETFPVPTPSIEIAKTFTSVAQEIDIDSDDVTDQFIALPGDEVEFEITVTNTGDSDAIDVVVRDDLTNQLPVGLILQSLDLGGGINLDEIDGSSGDESGEEGGGSIGDGDPQTIEVEFDRIAPGESKTITVNAIVSTENITSIGFSGGFGTADPSTGDLNDSLGEYLDRQVNGRIFLHTNFEKSAGESQVDFKHLNILNQAEVVSLNGQTLTPGSIADTARLDISSIDIQGELGNGQPLTIRSVEDIFDDNPDPTSFFFDPDPLWGSSGSPTNNQSEFLPPGVVGSSTFGAEWSFDKNDPEFQADFSVWTALVADGDLSDPQDERDVIDTFVERFIEKGVYRLSESLGGSFTLDNGSQTEILSFEAGEIAPLTAATVNVTVNDSGAFATDESGTSIGSFSDLQAALDSFNFDEATAIQVTIQDTDGDRIVQTRLQKLGGFNFEDNWNVQTIEVNDNVDRVNFVTSSGSAQLNLSLPEFQVTNAPEFTLSGFNLDDVTIGTPLNDKIEGLDGNDELSGSDGNDSIEGGDGSDVIEGGRDDDLLTGDSGSDTFEFGFDFGNDVITDFVGSHDEEEGNSGDGDEAGALGGGESSDPLTDFDLDSIDLTALSLDRSDLDSTGDGIVNASDNLASLVNESNLLLDLTALNGGSIEFVGVSSIELSAFVL
ncbi:MAG: DUF11 domain-containing protein [Cyanobacteria bacterium SBC]|nr:DUF11 domain-containing protein [Cyanobacteria bacterium SBC]